MLRLEGEPLSQRFKMFAADQGKGTPGARQAMSPESLDRQSHMHSAAGKLVTKKIKEAVKNGETITEETIRSVEDNVRGLIRKRTVQ